MGSKRKRSENWDSSDKILLKQLIEEKIGIIEDKSVDTNTSKKKREAWKEILISFNKCSSSIRDVAQIQCQWRNTKMQVKKRHSNYRKDQRETGGGPPPKSPDPEDEHIMSLIPNEFAVDHNDFDCDGNAQSQEFIETTQDVEFLIEELRDSPSEPKTPETQSINPNNGPSTSTKSKKTKSRKTHKIMCEEELKKRYLEIAIQAKTNESEHYQQKCLIEIENLRADNRRKEEKHQLELRHMQEEHEIRIQLIEQKRF